MYFKIWLEAVEGFQKWFLDILGLKEGALSTVTIGDIAGLDNKLRGYTNQLVQKWHISEPSIQDALDFARQFPERNLEELLKKLTEPSMPIGQNKPFLTGHLGDGTGDNTFLTKQPTAAT